MIAPAITRKLKFDPLTRTTVGDGDGVSVTDTMSSVPNTVAYPSKHLANSRNLISWAAIARPRCQNSPIYPCVQSLTFVCGTSPAACTKLHFPYAKLDKVPLRS